MFSLGLLLLLESEGRDGLEISSFVGTSQVFEELLAARDLAEESAARVEVFLVVLEVRSELLDLLSEDSDLEFW